MSRVSFRDRFVRQNAEAFYQKGWRSFGACHRSRPSVRLSARLPKTNCIIFLARYVLYKELLAGSGTECHIARGKILLHRKSSMRLGKLEISEIRSYLMSFGCNKDINEYMCFSFLFSNYSVVPLIETSRSELSELNFVSWIIGYFLISRLRKLRPENSAQFLFSRSKVECKIKEQ